MGLLVIFVELGIGDLYVQVAAIRHCVTRVCREVYEDLFYLSGIGIDAAGGRVHGDAKFDVLSDHTSEHRFYAV